MLTTQVYAGFQHNPPGIGFMGKKTWAPGKNLQKFIAGNFGIQPREQMVIVASVSDAVADVAGAVREAMTLYDGFNDIGKRMLLAWSEGIQGLRDERTYSAPGWTPGAVFDGLSKPAKLKSETSKIGRSPLVGKR
jgi:serine/threonine-protein kinase HipA